ncbi:MAG: transpeptidase family protein [Saprospiraceae bacterium]|nr:transpeptidase family protein [Saprospiraceae bacterium]
MSKRKELLLRAYIVLAVLILIALMLITATVNIGVFQAEQWREKGDSTKLKYFDIEPDRGNIYSADGYPLATSVPYFDLHMDLNSEAMTKSIFDANIDSLAIYFSRYVFTDASPASIKRKMIRRRNDGDRYFPIKNNATYEELKNIKSFPLIRLGKYRGGLIVERKSRRLKPFRNLASRTIGLDRDNAPSVGLEASFDDYLRGNAGKKLMERVGNVWIPVHDLTEIDPERGMNVVTTLDMRIQDIAEKSLLNALHNHNADFGLAIVMEVETGAIRAMVNLDRGNKGYYEAYNHAIGDATEPGSTFKLASVMALLEDGLVDLEDSIFINHGRAVFGKYQMKDSEWHKEMQLTLRRAFELSSNVGIARAVDQAYGGSKKDAAKYIKRLHQFGLNDKTGIQLEGERDPFIKDVDSDSWNMAMSLAWMAHGYELHITPLQTLTFYNAVANNGKKMRPYIVSEINDGTTLVKRFKPEVLDSRIASSATIKLAQELLEGVVIRGTGSAFKSNEYNFAGKTGTTRLEYWKDDGRKYQASFAGYFPAEKPKYSCIVLVNNPTQNGYYGATVAGTVFREIADNCMATDIELMAKATVPLTEEKAQSLPVFQAGYSADIQTVVKKVGLNFDNNSNGEWAILMPGEEQISLENRSLEKGLVPNVVGMGVRDAIFILENRGMSVKVNGFGRVREQSVAAGTRISGQKILLYLG